MTIASVELGRVIRVHYGAALKEAERDTSGKYAVFGSSGPIGTHSQALFTYPSIVVGRKGSAGSITYAPSGGWAIDTAFFIERISPDECDLRYLYHALTWADLGRHRIVTSIPGLSRDDIYRTRIPLPARSEQRRIADMLDKADDIRRKRREAIALTDDLLRSTFLDMFGDPVTNPKGWPTTTVEDLCARGGSLVDGPFGSSLKPDAYVDAGVKVVRNWNINDDRFDDSAFKFVPREKYEELRRSDVKAGDILITTKGTVGDVCVAPDLGGPAILSASGTVRFRLPGDGVLLPEFAVGQMITPAFKRYIRRFESGSAQQYLNLSAVRKFRLILPDLVAQMSFTAARAKMRAVAAKYSADWQAADALRDSLSKQAFGVGGA